MARRHRIEVRRTLKRLLSSRRIRRTARDTGVLARERKVDIVAFVWTLVLGFAVGNGRTLAGLRRAYQSATGTRLVPSAFYDRFTNGLVRLLRELLQHVIESVCITDTAMRGVLADFKDVLIADTTVVRLHDMLRRAYAACRTNHTLAALKAHVVLSVKGAGPRRIKLTSERVHDGPVLRAGAWVRDRLLLFDRAYYRFQLFSCIARQGGFFITRLKDKTNPLIVGVHRRWRGASVPLVGERLQEVLAKLQRRVIDIDVDLCFRKRSYRGHRSTGHFRCRLVGVRNERGEYYLYVTNVPPSRLSADDIARTYRARWVIELVFRELKLHYRLDDIPSRKRRVVDALVFAALITMIASRTLLGQLRARMKAEAAARLPTERWAAVFAAFATELLAIVVRSRRDGDAIARYVVPNLVAEAVDPNLSRWRLLPHVEAAAC